jgi:acyl carrier protein
MDDDAIAEGLTEIFRDVFMRDDLTPLPSWTAEDVEGWDSFKQIEIIMAVEDRFGVKMTTWELDDLESVGDLMKAIKVNLA